MVVVFLSFKILKIFEIFRAFKIVKVFSVFKIVQIIKAFWCLKNIFQRCRPHGCCFSPIQNIEDIRNIQGIQNNQSIIDIQNSSDNQGIKLIQSQRKLLPSKVYGGTSINDGFVLVRKSQLLFFLLLLCLKCPRKLLPSKIHNAS